MPIPLSRTLVLSVPQSGPVHVDLYDLTGRRLYTETVFLGAGRHVRRLNTSTLAAGLYFVHVRTASALATRSLIIIR